MKILLHVCALLPCYKVSDSRKKKVDVVIVQVFN